MDAKETAKKVCVGAYVPEKTQADLTKIAKEKEVAISDVIRFAIRDYIAKHEEKKES
ncbi:MAG: hypothetical protein IJQ87_05800 [Clostridia bacterium]|nr:hypothetical protein [Clostridia bacterium]MBQ6922123.1 hypothetical protein [Clostridia bacterium]MDY6368101.1 ORF56 family plasmid copy control protein [Clostridia bacterium]